MFDTEWGVPTFFKLLPFLCTMFFSVLAVILSEFYPSLIVSFKFTRFGYNLFGFFNQRFLIDMFYNKYITGLILRLGGHTTKILDKGAIELIGPFGLEKGLLILSKNIASLETGVITTYALYILSGFVLYILIPFLNLIDPSLLILILFALFSVSRESFFSLRRRREEKKNLYKQSIVLFSRSTYIFSGRRGIFLCKTS